MRHFAFRVAAELAPRSPAAGGVKSRSQFPPNPAFFLITCATFTLFFTAATLAQPAGGPPLALTDVPGKTGEFQLTLTERSPLSSPVEIAKRLHKKTEELGSDYDLSTQIFEAYVPPQSGEDGKYGLLVGVVFADNHGFAPAAWRPVLDQHHLIWIAPIHGADGTPDLSRMGEALDSVSNAIKSWPINPDRVYLSMNTWQRPTTGLGLYFPDVFTGVIGPFTSLSWIAKLPADNGGMWDTNHMPRPLDQYWNLARSHSRFFFPIRDNDKGNVEDKLIFQRGYQASGFRSVKMISVPRDQMDLWTNFKSDWFEQGIQYLDERPANAKPVADETLFPPATQSTAAPPADSSTGVSSPAPKPDDSAAKAASALSITKSYIAAQKFDIARPRLQKIIDTYPNTPAAKEAKNLLTQIQVK